MFYTWNNPETSRAHRIQLKIVEIFIHSVNRENMMVMNSKREKAEITLFFRSRGDRNYHKTTISFRFSAANLKLQIYSNHSTEKEKKLHISFIA